MALRKVYQINNVTENNFKVVKVLNEYGSMKEAQKALTDLLTHKTTERKLLKGFSKNN